MRPSSRRAAFTLIELLMAAGVFSSVALAIFAFTSTSMRLVIRNLATNHSHEAVRNAGQRMLVDLHNAGSRFGLISFDGTSYTDVTPAVTADQETLSSQFVSTHTNGVRFYRAAGGPFKLTADVATADVNLRFDFSNGGAVDYVPQVGDRLALPLINREFQITAVPTIPSSGSLQGVVTIDDVGGVGFSIRSGTGFVTVAYFYRKVAYTVFNNELRFHPNYEGSARASYQVVRGGVTSPKPFALLYPSGSAPTSDALNLRVSMESVDLQYSAAELTSNTTTLQTIIPPRNQPPQISSLQ